MTIDSSNFVQHTKKNKGFNRRTTGILSQPSYNPAKITVNHWQLRDLVQPSSVEKDDILYTHDDTIRSTNRNTDKVSTVCKLDFHPRCFKELDNNIAAGGVISSVNNSNSSTSLTNFNSMNDNQGSGSLWRGLFSFFSKDTQQSSTIRLGSYINNNISLNKISNGQYSSYVCNNDMFLYNTTINNASIVVSDSLNLDFPLNHSVLSDDHKNLVVVGDCSNIYLLHPNVRPSERLRRDNIIETQCDSGFSTSFDSSGLHFASCFQDGTCLIYDTRNLTQPLTKVYSTRKNSSNGAFRCVKYSRGTDDLLIISEHVGRVHVIDSRDFNNHQVIMLPVNSLPTRSNQTSAASLNNLGDANDSFITNVFTPKVLDYNDILNYEGNLVNSHESAFFNRNSFNSRSLNNFNLLSAFGTGSSESNITSSSAASSPNSTVVRNEYDFADNEISGVDWFEDRFGSHIVVGCDKGLISWDIDSWSRRSFPSIQLA